MTIIIKKHHAYAWCQINLMTAPYDGIIRIR